MQCSRRLGLVLSGVPMRQVGLAAFFAGDYSVGCGKPRAIRSGTTMMAAARG